MKPKFTPQSLLLAFYALLASASTGFAQTTVYRWVGTTSAWTTASNWAVVSGTGGTPPTTGGTIAARINVGTASALTPPNALTYTSAQGTTIFNPGSDRALVIASGGGSVTTATMTISGGTFDSRGSADDIIANGNAGNSGTLNISGGHYTNVNGGSSNLVVGFNGGTANLNISSGSATTGQIVFLMNTAGINTTANIALSGSGILETGGFTRVTPGSPATYSSNISFDGGTLRARGADNPNFMTSTVMTGNALVRAGGVTINTNGFNIGISKALTQDGTSTGGGLTKSGTGILTLSGTNTYTGLTTVSAGTLAYGASNVIASGAVTINGGTLSIGNHSDTVGTVTLTSGSITGTGGTLTGSSYAVESGDVSAILGGSGALTKSTAGTVTLSGPNTYTGATNVNAGTLIVTGSTSSSSNVSVSGTGSTLKGSGTIGGSVSIGMGGTLASGTSIESLATGTLTFDNGSNFEYEMNKDASPGTAGDLTAVTGDLNLNGTVDISFIELGSLGSWELGNPLGDHFGLSPADKLTLISYSGSWDGGLFTYAGNEILDDSPIIIGGQQWWFNYNDTDPGTNYEGQVTGTRFVTITVPEPGAALLGGIGTLLMLRRRRA